MDFRDIVILGTILVTMGVNWGAFKSLIKRVEVLEADKIKKDSSMIDFKVGMVENKAGIKSNTSDISGLKSDIIAIKKDVSKTRETSIENNIILNLLKNKLGV